jgi:hypothetical protein
MFIQGSFLLLDYKQSIIYYQVELKQYHKTPEYMLKLMIKHLVFNRSILFFRRNKTSYKQIEENIMFLPKMGTISKCLLLLTCLVFYHLIFSVYYL